MMCNCNKQLYPLLFVCVCVCLFTATWCSGERTERTRQQYQTDSQRTGGSHGASNGNQIPHNTNTNTTHIKHLHFIHIHKQIHTDTSKKHLSTADKVNEHTVYRQLPNNSNYFHAASWSKQHFVLRFSQIRLLHF